MGNSTTLQFLITAKDEASTTLKSLSDNAGKIGAAFTVAGGVITAALGLAVKEAADAQVKMAQFNTTLDNSKGGTKQVREALLAASEATQKLGFDNDETEQSLAKFFQRTGDVTTAIKLNTVAMDLSRAKNIDLSTATTLVNQVLSGNGRVLKQYGIDLKEAGTPLEALNQLHQLTANSATNFTNTLEGQSAVLRQSFRDLEKEVGNALIPIITDLMKQVTPVIEGVIAWAHANPELTQKIILATAAVGGLMVVLGPLLIALPTLTAAFTILAGPVGIIIAILGTLALTVSNVVQIADLLLNHWKEVWEGIKLETQDAVNAIIGFFQPLISTISNVGSGISSVLGAVKSAGSAVGGAVSGTFNNAVNAITGKRATGGPVGAGGTYLVGERGPELFTPTNSGFITANGGGSINININGAVMTVDAANQLGKIIMQQLKRVSKIGI